MGSCARKLKTGFTCGDVVEMWDALWRGEGKVRQLIFVNQARCKYHIGYEIAGWVHHTPRVRRRDRYFGGAQAIHVSRHGIQCRRGDGQHGGEV